MSKTCIVTGTEGQDGSILTEKLLDKGYTVVGVCRWNPNGFSSNMDSFINHDNFKLETGDITEKEFISRLMLEYQPDYFYNLAAISLVPESFRVPVRVFETNTLAVLYMLEAIRTHSPNTRFYQASCYDDKTRVLTKEGLKTYKEVKKGDLVYTVNEETNELELKPVKKVVKSYYKGNEMVRLKSRRFNFLVTPNHRMLYKQNNKLFYEEALNTSGLLKYEKNSDLELPTPIWYGKSERQIKIKHNKLSTANTHFTSMDYGDFMYLLGLYIGDGWCGTPRKTKRYYSKKEQSNRREKNGTFKSLDGTEEEEKIVYDNNLVSFAIPKTDSSRKKLIKILNKYNIRHNRDHAVNVTFSCSGLKSLFKEAGENVYEKHIPEKYLNKDGALLQKLYEGLIDSDGHRRNGRETFVTTSKRLSEQFVELVIKLGRICKVNKINPRKNIKIDDRLLNTSISYSINIVKKKTRKIYKHNITTESYDGVVWCLVMEDNHNFIVERNGFYMFSGNTSEQIGDNTEKSQSTDSKMLPNSPYAIAKLASYHLVRSYRKAHGLFAVNGMLWNHESTRRGPTFVTRKVSLHVGKQLDEVLQIGNLDAYRDWGYAGDYCDSMILMLEAEEADDYAVNTGESHTIRELVELAYSFKGLQLSWVGSGSEEKGFDQNGVLRVEVNKDFYRPVEVPFLNGDNSKIKNKLGWKPKTTFRDLIREMVEFDSR